jgi:hypothetical protein
MASLRLVEATSGLQEIRSMADTVYRSQVDSWLLVVFALSALAAVGACLSLLFYGSYLEWMVGALTLGLGIGLPLWILQSTTYTVTTGFLVIRSGPFHWGVPLRQIKKITPTRNPLSSPALSLDRLRIEYSDVKAIMISPENRKEFLADLRSRGVNCV